MCHGIEALPQNSAHIQPVSLLCDFVVDTRFDSTNIIRKADFNALKIELISSKSAFCHCVNIDN